MSERMRERFETFVTTQMLDSVARDAEGQYRNHDVKFAENVWKAAWQAALSSSGTSGMARCGQKFYSVQTRNTYICVLPKGHDGDCDDCENRGNYKFGDSLSGKGATKKCPKCGGEVVGTPHGFYCPKPTCKWGWETEMDGSPLQPPSAPDRAEELAQDKFAELRSFLTNMRRDAADAEDPELSEYAQAIEQRLDELASLLREAMGRWIPVSERLPEYGSCVMVYGYTVDDPEKINIQDIATYSYHGGWCVGLEEQGEFAVTHWRELAAPPREGG